MTAIVGVEHKGFVYIGADSAIQDDSRDCVFPCENPKVWRLGKNAIIGVAGSLKPLQTLMFGPKLDVPNKLDNTEAWLVTRLVPHIQRVVDNWDNEALVGIRGKLWAIDSDWSCTRVGPEYACGSGGQIARGALHATRARTPQGKIVAALSAAADLCTGVIGPFAVLSDVDSPGK